MNAGQSRTFRTAWAILFIVVAVLAIAFVQTSDRIEGNFKFPWTMGILLLAVLALNVLIVQAEQGEMALVEATPEKYHELGTLAALTSKTWNNPALSGHLLLVRNDTEAAGYELP